MTLKSAFRTVLATTALMCLTACGLTEDIPVVPGEINFLNVDGYTAVLDRDTHTFTATIPAVTDFS